MMFWRKKKKEDASIQDVLADNKESVIAPQDVETETETKKLADQTSETEIEPATEIEPETETEAGWLSRLTSGLSKSTNKLSQNLTDILTKKKLDQDALDELEDALIMADLGPKTAARIVEEFAKGRFEKDIDENEIREALASQIEEILSPVAAPLIPKKQIDGTPFVILVTGVNGVGKTTTIGKLARQYQDQGLKVVMAAADTFRAAAVDQLSVWAERNECLIVKKDVGADPAAVAFEAYDVAKEQGADVLMIDTAGRLHNKKNLMEELQKIVRVLKKQNDTAPHASLLVLDATTGQNALSQAEAFKELVDVSGLIVTKLDGSAKGGVLVSLADQFNIPVHAIGVGETIEDLQPFTARSFARSLMGLSD
jgi:fused signal recognition particle receptor